MLWDIEDELELKLEVVSIKKALGKTHIVEVKVESKGGDAHQQSILGKLRALMRGAITLI